MSENQRGVILIGLIVACLVTGVLAMPVVPKIGGWLEQYRLCNTARDIAYLMRTAQVNAGYGNTEYRVRIECGTGTLRLQRNDRERWADERFLSLPPGIRIKEVILPGGMALFRSNAMSSPPGCLTLTDLTGVEKRIILIPGTGRVNIE